MDQRVCVKGPAVGGPERIEWRRSFPSRSLAALAWYAVVAALIVAAALLLFGSEQPTLDTGERNPLADIPMWTEVLVGLGAVPFVLAVIRRPRVGANHFALTVRPGWVRTLVLPWSHVAEVTTAEVAGERYLLVRCRTGLDRMGDSPHWVDQAVLRAMARERSKKAKRFDLAVRLRDFTPAVDGQMTALAAFAPDHVLIANAT
jgi:hypothetical protein